MLMDNEKSVWRNLAPVMTSMNLFYQNYYYTVMESPRTISKQGKVLYDFHKNLMQIIV